MAMYCGDLSPGSPPWSVTWIQATASDSRAAAAAGRTPTRPSVRLASLVRVAVGPSCDMVRSFGWVRNLLRFPSLVPQSWSLLGRRPALRPDLGVVPGRSTGEVLHQPAPLPRRTTRVPPRVTAAG